MFLTQLAHPLIRLLLEISTCEMKRCLTSVAQYHVAAFCARTACLLVLNPRGYQIGRSI